MFPRTVFFAGVVGLERVGAIRKGAGPRVHAMESNALCITCQGRFLAFAPAPHPKKRPKSESRRRALRRKGEEEEEEKTEEEERSRRKKKNQVPKRRRKCGKSTSKKGPTRSRALLSWHSPAENSARDRKSNFWTSNPNVQNFAGEREMHAGCQTETEKFRNGAGGNNGAENSYCAETATA